MSNERRDETLHRRDPLEDVKEARAMGIEPLESTGSESSTLEYQARAWSERLAFDALSRVSSMLSSNLDTASLVSQILDVAIATVGAERGILWLGKGRAADLVPIAARSLGGESLAALERVSRTVVMRAGGGDPIESRDALTDPELHDIPSVRVHRIRSVACLPLQFRGERVGLLYLDHGAPAAFAEHAHRFLEAFAGLAGVALENARVHGDLLRENARIRERLGAEESFGRIVTSSARMRGVLRQAAMVARADGPVMLLGESGTGKELLARALHEASGRALAPFVAFNCAAVPRDLVESTFFGHVRGAFTGAVRDVPGLFAQADRGVLLLDEIADLDLAVQAKLLRVLQERTIRPVGADREIAVNVRVIAATSRDLDEALRSGRFREDLYYRLNVLTLRIPPLRDRREDVPGLVEHFCARLRSSGALDADVRFTHDAVAYLQSLEWRGNVRELENLVQRVCVLAEGPERTADIIRSLELGRAVASGSDVQAQRSEPADPPLTMAEREADAIRDALARARGNKTQAAALLGLHRNALVRRMQRLGIRWVSPAD